MTYDEKISEFDEWHSTDSPTLASFGTHSGSNNNTQNEVDEEDVCDRVVSEAEIRWRNSLEIGIKLDVQHKVIYD